EQAKRLRFEHALHLRPEDRLAIGVFFIGEADDRRDRVKAIVHEVLAAGPFRWLGWRPVPTHDDALPKLARDTKPYIEHLLLLVEGDAAAAALWLYHAR